MLAWRLVGGLLALGLVVLGMAVLAARALGVPVDPLMQDVTGVAGVPPWTGAVSMLNVAVWSAVAALSAFVAWTAPVARRSLLLLAALAAVLGADDALLLHERLGPRNGVPEVVFVVVYAVGALGLTWLLAPRRAGAAGWAYLLGASLLGTSLLVDVVLGHEPLLEDGPKLLGTLVWIAVPVLWHQRAVSAGAPGTGQPGEPRPRVGRAPGDEVTDPSAAGDTGSPPERAGRPGAGSWLRP